MSTGTPTNDSEAGVSCCDLLCDSVICGDNVTVMKEWPGECIDLVVTSPPYDDLRKYGGHDWNFEAIAEQLVRCLKPGGVIVWVVGDATVDGSETLTSMRQAIHFKDVCGLNMHDTMIYKQSGTGAKGSNKSYWQEWEYQFVLAKGSPKTVNRIADRPSLYAGEKTRGSKKMKRIGSRADRPRIISEMGVRGNVWEYGVGNNGDDKTDHPAPFPEALAIDHVKSWSNPGEIVLDPFAGSGTALKAAKELNRRYIGIEINPEYVEICNNRTAQEVLPLFTT